MKKSEDSKENYQNPSNYFGDSNSAYQYSQYYSSYPNQQYSQDVNSYDYAYYSQQPPVYAQSQSSDFKQQNLSSKSQQDPNSSKGGRTKQKKTNKTHNKQKEDPKTGSKMTDSSGKRSGMDRFGKDSGRHSSSRRKRSDSGSISRSNSKSNSRGREKRRARKNRKQRSGSESRRSSRSRSWSRGKRRKRRSSLSKSRSRSNSRGRHHHSSSHKKRSGKNKKIRSGFDKRDEKEYRERKARREKYKEETTFSKTAKDPSNTLMLSNLTPDITDNHVKMYFKNLAISLGGGDPDDIQLIPALKTCYVKFSSIFTAQKFFQASEGKIILNGTDFVDVQFTPTNLNTSSSLGGGNSGIYAGNIFQKQIMGIGAQYNKEYGYLNQGVETTVHEDWLCEFV
jgi:hypothetical protein